MKKIVLALSLFLVLAFSGCGAPEIHNYLITEDFDGKNVGIITGKTDENFVRDRIGNPKIKRFNNAESGIKALKKGKVAGMILDAVMAESYVENDRDLVLLLEEFEKKKYVYPVKMKPVTEENFYLFVGATLSIFHADGTYDRLLSKYFKDDSENYTFDENYEKREGAVLKIAVDSSLGLPMCAKTGSGELTGFCADLAREFARYYGGELKLIDLPRSEIPDALERDEAYFALSDFTEDEEYPKHVLADYEYFNASQYLVHLNPLLRKK